MVADKTPGRGGGGRGLKLQPRTRKHWIQQCIWHSEHHGQERRTFLHNPLLKTPLNLNFLLLDSLCDTLRHFATLSNTWRHFATLPGLCSEHHKLVITRHKVSKVPGTVVLKIISSRHYARKTPLRRAPSPPTIFADAIPKNLGNDKTHVLPSAIGRPGRQTMEMNGSSASYLACSPCVPLLCASFNRGWNRRAFRLPGEGGDHFYCTVEPSPGHTRRRWLLWMLDVFVCSLRRSQTGRIPFRRALFQTLSSVSFLRPHRVPGRELRPFLSAYYVCAKANSPSLLQNSVSSLHRNSCLETVLWPFPKKQQKTSRDCPGKV